jgi:hypothetical protein
MVNAQCLCFQTLTTLYGSTHSVFLDRYEEQALRTPLTASSICRAQSCAFLWVLSPFTLSISCAGITGENYGLLFYLFHPTSYRANHILSNLLVPSIIYGNMSTLSSQPSSASLNSGSTKHSEVSDTSALPKPFPPPLKCIPVTVYEDVPFSLEGSKPSRHLEIPSELFVLRDGSLHFNLDCFEEEWKCQTGQHFQELRRQYKGKPCQGMLSFVEQNPDGQSYRGVAVSDTVGCHQSGYQDLAEFAILTDWTPKHDSEIPASHVTSLPRSHLDSSQTPVAVTDAEKLQVRYDQCMEEGALALECSPDGTYFTWKSPDRGTTWLEGIYPGVGGLRGVWSLG